jgi:molybdate transport repressor ModE-like protein
VLITRRGGESGGSARLTAEARRLVQIFARWQAEVDRLSKRAFDRALSDA